MSLNPKSMDEFLEWRRQVRFWHRVDRTAGSAGCWIWHGTHFGNGSAQVRWRGKIMSAARVAFALHRALTAQIAYGGVQDGAENSPVYVRKYFLLSRNELLRRKTGICTRQSCVNPNHYICADYRSPYRSPKLCRTGPGRRSARYRSLLDRFRHVLRRGHAGCLYIPRGRQLSSAKIRWMRHKLWLEFGSVHSSRGFSQSGCGIAHRTSRAGLHNTCMSMKPCFNPSHMVVITKTGLNRARRRYRFLSRRLDTWGRRLVDSAGAVSGRRRYNRRVCIQRIVQIGKEMGLDPPGFTHWGGYKTLVHRGGPALRCIRTSRVRLRV